MQIAVTYVFFDAHWQTVTSRLSEGLGGRFPSAVLSDALPKEKLASSMGERLRRDRLDDDPPRPRPPRLASD